MNRAHIAHVHPTTGTHLRTCSMLALANGRGHAHGRRPSTSRRRAICGVPSMSTTVQVRTFKQTMEGKA